MDQYASRLFVIWLGFMIRNLCLLKCGWFSDHEPKVCYQTQPSGTGFGTGAVLHDTFAKTHCSLNISSQYTGCVYAASNSNWVREEPEPKKGDTLEPWAQEFRNRGGASKIYSSRGIANSIFEASVLAVCTQPASSSVSMTARSLGDPFRWIFAS